MTYLSSLQKFFRSNFTIIVKKAIQLNVKLDYAEHKQQYLTIFCIPRL